MKIINLHEGRKMKIKTGTSQDEIKINQGENLHDYLWQTNERVLVLQNPKGEIEKNKIVTTCFNNFIIMRLNPESKRIESLIYDYRNYNQDTIELINRGFGDLSKQVMES